MRRRFSLCLLGSAFSDHQTNQRGSIKALPRPRKKELQLAATKRSGWFWLWPPFRNQVATTKPWRGVCTRTRLARPRRRRRRRRSSSRCCSSRLSHRRRSSRNRSQNSPCLAPGPARCVLFFFFPSLPLTLLFVLVYQHTSLTAYLSPLHVQLTPCACASRVRAAAVGSTATTLPS